MYIYFFSESEKLVIFLTFKLHNTTNMKFLIPFLLIVFVTSMLSAQKSVPDVDVQDLEGKRVNLKEYTNQGHFTILSFWATWCKPCKTELDAIYEIYPDWQDEFGVELVAVSIDDSRTSRKVIPMVEQKNWPYTILTDSNQNVQRALNFRSIPQTFLVNKEGQIIYSHNGYTPGAEYELEDKMRAAMME